MERTKRRPRLPLSKMFVNAVLDATASCLDSRTRQKISSVAIPDTSSHLSLTGKSLLNDDDVVSVSSVTSTSVSAVTSTSCQPFSAIEAHHSVAYFRILIEDANDRLEEASKFFQKTDSYSFKSEFHVQILNDLHEELGKPPQHMEVEECDKVAQLRYRLQELQLNLVERRIHFLVRVNGKSRNLEISPPAEAKPFLTAAAEARAARKRQCEMVLLVEMIANLAHKEEKYKQRRLKAEAELLRYVDTLVQPSDNNDAKERIHIGDFISKNQVIGNGQEFGCSSTHLSTNSLNIGRQWEISDAKFSSSASNQEILLSKPTSPCIFCGELHWSRLCLTISTLEKRTVYYLKHNICPICGINHRGACADTVRFCKWPSCRAKNSHDSALCPNVEYPITVKIIQAHVRQLNYANPIHDYSKVSEWLSNCKLSSSPSG